MTESNTQPELHTSTLAHSIYSAEFATEEEAAAFYNEELEKTELTKVADLDFVPTDDEVRTNVVTLDVTCIDTEDEDNPEFIETSDYYWID